MRWLVFSVSPSKLMAEEGMVAQVRSACGRRSTLALAVVCMLLVVLSGCVTRGHTTTEHRPFNFQTDTFAFPNQLRWEYLYDEKGHWTTRDRIPPATYSQHCFVLARSARQFFINAHFAPEMPPTDDRTYRKLIRKVVASNPRKELADDKKIVIPGFADLHAFSTAHELLLKQECGGAWQSYFQRGHWRSVMPFSRGHQAVEADRLLAEVEHHEAPVIHLVRFPQLTINHAVVLYEAHETGDEIEFVAYDPNIPEKPRSIFYDRKTRTFILPPNDYFPGGRVDVYEVFNHWYY